MLHTVNKSPFEKNSLQTCLRLSRPGHKVLLIEDGVYGALNHTEHSDALIKASEDRQIYVLAPDLKARGIEDGQLMDCVQQVDYNGFVALAAESDKVQSWF